MPSLKHNDKKIKEFELIISILNKQGIIFED